MRHIGSRRESWCHSYGHTAWVHGHRRSAKADSTQCEGPSTTVKVQNLSVKEYDSCLPEPPRSRWDDHGPYHQALRCVVTCCMPVLPNWQARRCVRRNRVISDDFGETPSAGPALGPHAYIYLQMVPARHRSSPNFSSEMPQHLRNVTRQRGASRL